MLPEEKNSTPRQQDAFDAFLKRKLQEAPSAMPDSMLQSILEKNRKRKAAMFFWLNTVVLLYIACWFLAGLPIFEKSNGNPPRTDLTMSNVLPEGLKNNLPQASGAAAAAAADAETANATTQETQQPIQDAVAPAKDIAPHKTESPRHTKRTTPIKVIVETEDVIVNPEDETTGQVATQGTEGNEEGTHIANPEPKIEWDADEKVADAADNQSDDKSSAGTTSKGKTPKGKKPAKGGVDTKNPKHWKCDAWMGLGMVRDQVDFQVAEFDARYYHKDFASVLAQTAPKLTGTQLGVGLRGFITDRVTLDGGLQFAQMQSIVNFEYTVKEIPIVDTNEMILGYFPLPDTSQKGFSYTGTSNFTRIGIPLQIGYTYPLGKTWQLTGSVGLMPQVTLHQTMTGFERVDLSKFGSLQLENYIRVPATFSLGLYRNEDRFTYGLMGRVSPFYGREIQIGDGMRYGSLRLRGYDVGFRIMYQFGGAAKK